VSNLDELDEFEAEAELRLKREYGAVFTLFRYCVLTQDATYLCNKLDMQYVPQPNYPFFHLEMEDVWVWDKNRPTRMIPRAEVYTSSDVTIEELRGEGDGPALTPEALATIVSRRPSGAPRMRLILFIVAFWTCWLGGSLWFQFHHSQDAVKRYRFRLDHPEHGQGRDDFVDARNELEARRLIASSYRESTPSADCDFASFSSHRIVWLPESASS